ncbi:MAG: 3-mercaptopyruvate sulfurtransferase [Methyloligellaceae bacterium]
MENPALSDLVETSWLNENTGRDDIKIIDATWYMPGFPENAYDQFTSDHIPGSVFFDIDAISDKSTDLPHMLPSTQQFASAVNEMGISNDNHVIVYDRLGIFSSPRVWWTFKVMGHDNVSVLNGGFKKWISEGYPVESGKTSIIPGKGYTANRRPTLVSGFDSLLKHIKENQDISILDARPGDRFAGLAEEPRPGLKKGHMPGAVNLFFGDLINSNGTFKSVEELTNILKNKNIATDKPVITTCGSGITASILFLALYLTGAENLSVYDGSWAEWGAHDQSIIEL